MLRGCRGLRDPSKQADPPPASSPGTASASSSASHPPQQASSRAQTWAEKLFRDEDSFPHKNIAYCRDEFRVCLVSQLAAGDLDEYLFGSEWGGLPAKELFQVLVVNTEDDDEEDEDS